MNIAIDYDCTFTADPTFWTAVMLAGEKRGHKFFCVTKREPNLGTPGLPESVETIYTSRRSKIATVQERGISINIWIDDEPYGVLFNDGQRVQLL